MDNKQQQDKDNIQNTLKTLQEKSQNIEKLLEKGSDVLVFQFGSHSIKYGFANQLLPEVLPTKIGYYKESLNENKNLIDIDYTTLSSQDQRFDNLEAFLRRKNNIKGEGKYGSVKIKQKSRIEIPPSFKGLPNEPLDKKKFYYEDEIYQHQDNPNFIIKEPIKHGLFNISPSYPYEEIVGDLEQITRYLVTEKLQLTQQEINNYGVVLIVPDILHKGQIKSIINIFLKRLAFQRLYMHQESVLSSFGYNAHSACIVDIGSGKINIACVEEGVLLLQTVIRKHFGGNDINLILHNLLSKKDCYSYMNNQVKIDPSIRSDYAQIEGVKELASSYVQADELMNNIYEGVLLRERQETLLIPYSDAFISSHAAYFHSDLLNGTKQTNPKTEKYFRYDSDYFESYLDPEDIYDESGMNILYGLALIAEQQQQEENKEEQLPGEEGAESSNQKMIPEKPAVKSNILTKDNLVEVMDPFQMQNLDHLICLSICQIPPGELRKRLANNIIITGGGCQVINTAEELEDRLNVTFRQYDPEIQEVNILDPLVQRDIPPYAISWVGGSVLQRLDSLKECWIPRSRWIGNLDGESDDEEDEEREGGRKIRKEKIYDNFGVKLLREKLPFLW